MNDEDDAQRSLQDWLDEYRDTPLLQGSAAELAARLPGLRALLEKRTEAWLDNELDDDRDDELADEVSWIGFVITMTELRLCELAGTADPE